MMREANFVTVFCGIETPNEAALKLIHKEQNLRQPILESIKAINDYGIEVVSGIILGLDSDTPETGRQIVDFVHESKLPMLTINLLQALPKTPLWRRLEVANRIVERPGGDHESNVEFLLPYETVSRMWRESVQEVYAPEAIYERFGYQMDHVFPRRKRLPTTRARLNLSNVERGLSILARVFYHVGLCSDYRAVFWKHAYKAVRKLDLEGLIHAAAVSHHMILFARECVNGEAEKTFYGFSEPAAASRALQNAR